MHKLFKFKQRSILLTIIWQVIILIIAGCAKVGVPTGGEKDTYPPVFQMSEPPQYTTNFDEKSIDIYFDEYLQFKELNKELLISPPLPERPLITVREKSVRIILNNELIPKTTYTINFGNSIADNNEGNILPDFEYVLSTGSTIDSLSVTGKVRDAFTHQTQPENVVMVMLYENLADSAPLKEIPRYVGRINKYGLFSINNIPPGIFRIIALMDKDRDLLYDPGEENIAFLDSLTEINPSTVEQVTFIKDTIKTIYTPKKANRKSNLSADAMLPDTIITSARNLNAVNVSLNYFREEVKRVFIADKKRESPERIQVFFNRPPYSEITPVPVNFKPEKDWFMQEFSMKGDTVTYWITDSLLAKKDSIIFSLQYTTTDSINNYIERTDTLTFRHITVNRAPAGRRNRNVTTAGEIKRKLNVTSNVNDKGILELNNQVSIMTSSPLQLINTDSIELWSQEDTIKIKNTFSLEKDKQLIRKAFIDANWKENMQYKLLLKPGAIQDIYGLSNDSIEINFKIREGNYYSRILLSVNCDKFPMIIQLLSSSNTIVRTKILQQPEPVVFDYLIPGQYSLKAIFDKNKNNEWDTGDYIKKVQPEPVYFYQLPDALRSDWDHDFTWNISD